MICKEFMHILFNKINIKKLMRIYLVLSIKFTFDTINYIKMKSMLKPTVLWLHSFSILYTLFCIWRIFFIHSNKRVLEFVDSRSLIGRSKVILQFFIWFWFFIIFLFLINFFWKIKSKILKKLKFKDSKFFVTNMFY